MEITKEMLEMAATKANHAQLKVMYDAMKAERDALAAQVEALRKALAALSVQAESALQEDIVCYSALKRAQCEADEVLDKSPQHHLRELRAEAVIKFVSQFEDKTYWNKSINDFISEGYQYADSIRQGGAE